MHLGSLESTQEARVAFGCASSNSYASFVLSKLPACIHIRTLSMNQFLIGNKCLRAWKSVKSSTMSFCLSEFVPAAMPERWGCFNIFSGLSLSRLSNSEKLMSFKITAHNLIVYICWYRRNKKSESLQCKLMSVLYPPDATAINISLLSGCCVRILRGHNTSQGISVLGSEVWVFRVWLFVTLRSQGLSR